MTESAPKPIGLNQANLKHLSSAVQTPIYDRRSVARSIVHIGVGGFFRAHQAVYLDDLLHQPGHSEWGYCGVGLLGHDERMRDALLPQDCLYTVVERSADGDRVISRKDIEIISQLIDLLPQEVIDGKWLVAEHDISDSVSCNVKGRKR